MSAEVALLGPADVRTLASQLDVRPTKRLGQNFVHDANTVRRIVAAADLSPDDVVLEVGPGLGSLTLALLTACRAVVAVEIDPTLAAALPTTVATRAPALASRLHVIPADALRLSTAHFAPAPQPTDSTPTPAHTEDTAPLAPGSAPTSIPTRDPAHQDPNTQPAAAPITSPSPAPPPDPDTSPRPDTLPRPQDAAPSLPNSAPPPSPILSPRPDTSTGPDTSTPANTSPRPEDPASSPRDSASPPLPTASLPVPAASLPRSTRPPVPTTSVLNSTRPPVLTTALPDSTLPPLPTALVANLPYNVAVPVVLHLLAELPSLRTGLVMVQAEVADRLAAEPGNRTYGVPSVKAAWFADVRRAGGVPRSVFWPVPNVDSALVAFTRRTDAFDAPRDVVFSLVDAAFAQRRKTLRAALAGWAGSAAAAGALLTDAGLSPSVRGEQLGVTDFVRLAEVARAAGLPRV